MLITRTHLQRFIAESSGEFEVFAPYRAGDRLSLARSDPQVEPILEGCRPTEPLKALLYPAREEILPPASPVKKRLILGVRNCDLAALSLLDQALLGSGGFVDPAYRNRRELTYLAAADCTDPLSTCHCDLAGLKPYPESGYDLVLSPVGTGLFLTAATPKGEEIAALLRNCADPDEGDGEHPAREIEANRRRTLERLTALNAGYKDYEWKEAPKGWGGSVANCVECGACNYICPTCYCLVLHDETQVVSAFRKNRTWDSCQHAGYARVAGGASPEPHLWQRFRHRYHCKFRIMREQFSRLGCTGCGRCIEACPGRIDQREVMGGR